MRMRADIAVATALQLVQPASADVVHAAHAQFIRPMQRDPEVANEYADLLEWRDWLYATHNFRIPAA